MYHDMRIGNSDELAMQTSAPAEVSALLKRYPNLAEAELARLINSYRELSALDAALLMTDTVLTKKLGSFVAEHRRAVRPPFRQYAALLLFAVLGAMLIAWVVVGS